MVLDSGLVELFRRGFKENTFYWKDSKDHEADFVVAKDKKVTQLIQVCHNLADENTKKREIRSLVAASKELRCKSLLIITEEKEGEDTVTWFGTTISTRYLPLWKWLLS